MQNDNKEQEYMTRNCKRHNLTSVKPSHLLLLKYEEYNRNNKNDTKMYANWRKIYWRQRKNHSKFKKRECVRYLNEKQKSQTKLMNKQTIFNENKEENIGEKSRAKQ